MYRIGRAIIVAGCLALLPWGARGESEMVQYSTIEALLGGVLAGNLTLDALVDEGDFGIGTFNDLDGEMVVLGGTVYQVRGDGTVHQPPLSTKTPYAAVCDFDGDKAQKIDGMPAGLDYVALQAQIDKLLPSLNLFYAIKIDGTFSALTARSVPAQKKPYPPLAEIVKNQPIFKFDNVKGTLVGFRCPAYVKGVNVPGYHFHFLTEDKKGGGHVLALTTGEVQIKYVKLDSWEVMLPDTIEFLEAPLGKDMSKELKAVETAK